MREGGAIHTLTLYFSPSPRHETALVTAIDCLTS